MSKKKSNKMIEQSNVQVATDIAVKLEEPKRYHVVMLNDDYTPMDFVVDVLMDYFEKSREEAEVIMLDIHHKGQGIAGTYSLEVAKEKANQVHHLAEQQEYPLSCQLKREL